MILFEIKSVAAFMKALLVKDIFDDFVMIKGNVATLFSSDFDGAIVKEFQGEDNIEKFIKYSTVRPLLLQLIRGDKPPIMFKLILGASQEQIGEFQKENLEELSNIAPTGLFLNIRYENSGLILSSGCSTSIFDKDRALDKLWDKSLERFLRNNDLIL